MKQTQEFEGKNVEQAIEKACTALNVTRKKLSYDVISSGSSGIFGIVGVKKARIRATLPEKNISETDFAKSSTEDDELDGVMSIVDEAFAEPAEKSRELPPKKHRNSQPRKVTFPEENNNRKTVPRKDPRTFEDKNRKVTQTIETRSFEENDRKVPQREEIKAFDLNDPKVPAREEPAKETEVPAPEVQAPELLEPEIEKSGEDAGDFVEDSEEGDLEEDFNEDLTEEIDDRDEGYPPKYKDEVPVDVSQESVDLGIKTLQQMVDLITTDSTVIAETDQDRLLLKVEGGNSGVLIGRRGQTLEAMQFLTDKIINRKSESRVRLKIDIEGYMETRKANLQSLAHKMADKAKKTGKPATINQMTAQDRRIVHLALKEDPRVRTQSMGDGYYRRLVIFPKKGSFKKRKVTRS